MNAAGMLAEVEAVLGDGGVYIGSGVLVVVLIILVALLLLRR